MMPHKKVDVRDVIEEYLAWYPDGIDENGALVLDQHMQSVLRRLAGSERAHAAINVITKTAANIRELADLCMDAEWLMRTFAEKLTEERKMVENLHRHRQSVEDLRQFVSQVSKSPDHPWVGWVGIEKVEEKNFHETLTRMAALIELRRETTDIAMVDLGVNRKSVNANAAETKAIGFLAGHVFNAFGKPFALQVAVLAEVAFDKHVGNCRRAQEWKKPRTRDP